MLRLCHCWFALVWLFTLTNTIHISLNILSFLIAGGNGISKSPYGAWVEYIDKRTHQSFYYNTVSRNSQRDKPKDFKPDKNRVIKEVIYGMSFYH